MLVSFCVFLRAFYFEEILSYYCVFFRVQNFFEVVVEDLICSNFFIWVKELKKIEYFICDQKLFCLFCIPISHLQDSNISLYHRKFQMCLHSHPFFTKTLLHITANFFLLHSQTK